MKGRNVLIIHFTERCFFVATVISKIYTTNMTIFKDKNISWDSIFKEKDGQDRTDRKKKSYKTIKTII